MINIIDRLQSLKDTEYAAFTYKLTPNLSSDSILGVRMPALRALAKEIKNTPEAAAFMESLPHSYYDEDNLHALLINEIRDTSAVMKALDAFLPYVNNWATCDALNPKCFNKNSSDITDKIIEYIHSDRTYTIRFGVCALMRHYLRDAFDPSYPEMLSKIVSDEYYVNMAIAWYFATAAAIRPEETIPYLTTTRLPDWTRRKAIQKCRESYRVSPEIKSLLTESLSKNLP